MLAKCEGIYENIVFVLLVGETLGCVTNKVKLTGNLTLESEGIIRFFTLRDLSGERFLKLPMFCRLIKLY